MNTISRAAVVIATAALALTAACSGAPHDTTLADSLLTQLDVGEGWSQVPYDVGGDPIERRVPGLCDLAMDLAEPQWQAGVGLHLVAAGEGQNRPDDALVEEYVLAADPAELDHTYQTLREGLNVCAGEGAYTSDEVNFTFRWVDVVDLDSTGDQGLQANIREALVDTESGDADLVQTRVVLVRSGSTLMMLISRESVHAAAYTGEWEPLDLIVTDADLNGIVTTAVDRLA